MSEQVFSLNRIFSYKDGICKIRRERHACLFHLQGLNNLIKGIYINSNFRSFPYL